VEDAPLAFNPQGHNFLSYCLAIALPEQMQPGVELNGIPVWNLNAFATTEPKFRNTQDLCRRVLRSAFDLGSGSVLDSRFGLFGEARSHCLGVFEHIE
jgi:hypothetical protein